MKEMLLFLVGFAIFAAIVLAIVFNKELKSLKIFRSNAEKKAARAAKKAAAEEEYFRRTSNKHYRSEEDSGKPNFAKDYFKSVDEETLKKEQEKQEKPKEEPEQPKRKTTTHEGVTIIDHRADHEASRKIFSDNEGEYVEFTEE